MTGATLAGTFTWTVPYTGGNGVYTIQFSAMQVQPPPISVRRAIPGTSPSTRRRGRP
jgi:hypothetical protein